MLYDKFRDVARRAATVFNENDPEKYRSQLSVKVGKKVIKMESLQNRKYQRRPSKS